MKQHSLAALGAVVGGVSGYLVPPPANAGQGGDLFGPRGHRVSQAAEGVLVGALLGWAIGKMR